MSNFICPTCGFTNIDCGKEGYKTVREIELEKKLEIAVKALEHYADKKNWEDVENYEEYYISAQFEVQGYKNSRESIKGD